MKSIARMTSDYANLVVSTGIRLYPGQCLLIRTGLDTYWFAQAIAESAYDRGAAIVRIEISDSRLIRKRTDVQSMEQLAVVPDFTKQTDYEMMAKDWAYVHIDTTEDRHWLANADAKRLAAYDSALRASGAMYWQSRLRHEHPWCVVCAPGPRWASSVLGPDASAEDLWRVLAPILKLDAEDPAQAWQDHAETLARRAKWLNTLSISSLRFRSAKTDLTVGFAPEHQWKGGGDMLPNGTWFLSNIPTEEVFTTPDRLTAEGYVATTRPVSVMDSLVENAVLTFKNGRVVSCTARVGQSIMDRFLAIDDGASLLGEVALVDEDSQIARSKIVFNSILYDENASCHLALGAGFPGCLSNARELSNDDKLQQAGCNTSLVHTDFMVGAPDMDITATTRDGRKLPVMHQGRFVR